MKKIIISLLLLGNFTFIRPMSVPEVDQKTVLAGIGAAAVVGALVLKKVIHKARLELNYREDKRLIEANLLKIGHLILIPGDYELINEVTDKGVGEILRLYPTSHYYSPYRSAILRTNEILQQIERAEKLLNEIIHIMDYNPRIGYSDNPLMIIWNLSFPMEELKEKTLAVKMTLLNSDEYKNEFKRTKKLN